MTLLQQHLQQRKDQLFPDWTPDLSSPTTYINTIKNKYARAAEPVVVIDEEEDVEEGTQLALYKPQPHQPSRHVPSSELEQVSIKHTSPSLPSQSQWGLSKVLIGHKGWVRCTAFDPSNKFFVTGSNDTTIKAWDLATGRLRLTLTSHLMAVRDLKISSRHPYLFSCGDDKAVKLWDLEKNTVVRDYHGHLSGVYSLDVHPNLDLLMTGSRDSSIKVWDIRTSIPVMTLLGHKNPITNVCAQGMDPQIVSTSQDKTVRLWDLRAAKTQTVLTHHKKSIRALALNPGDEWTFATASADSIRQWKFPDGVYLNSFDHVSESAIINTLSINQDGVMFAGGDDGEMRMYDYKTGKLFQESENVPVPGSLDSERGVLTSSFDMTGERLVIGGQDKSVRILKKQVDV